MLVGGKVAAWPNAKIMNQSTPSISTFAKVSNGAQKNMPREAPRIDFFPIRLFWTPNVRGEKLKNNFRRPKFPPLPLDPSDPTGL